MPEVKTKIWTNYPNYPHEIVVRSSSKIHLVLTEQLYNWTFYKITKLSLKDAKAPVVH